MPDSQRDRFLKRLSTVGAGLRQDIQLALAVLVTDLRELVIEGALPDDDVAATVALHDQVEALWQATLASNPPLRPDELHDRMVEVRQGCTGPIEGYGLRLDAVIAKARALGESKRLR
jgi:hypothetical protein